MINNLAIGAARVAIAPLFIYAGQITARTPEKLAPKAAPVLDTLRESVDFLPENDELLVRANGSMQVVAGTTMALNILPRASATALMASLIPTTWAGHAFWKETEKGARTAQILQFTKNMAVGAGLLAIATHKKSKKKKKK